MNVKVPRPDSRTRCHAYGLAFEEQNIILDQMTDMVREMRAIGRTTLLPFQKGKLLNIFCRLNLLYITFF